MSTKKSPSALARLFDKQRKNIPSSKRQANLLKTFAEDDYKRIAQLIKVWLEQDEIQRQRKK